MHGAFYLLVLSLKRSHTRWLKIVFFFAEDIPTTRSELEHDDFWFVFRSPIYLKKFPQYSSFWGLNRRISDWLSSQRLDFLLGLIENEVSPREKENPGVEKVYIGFERRRRPETKVSTSFFPFSPLKFALVRAYSNYFYLPDSGDSRAKEQLIPSFTLFFLSLNHPCFDVYTPGIYSQWCTPCELSSWVSVVWNKNEKCKKRRRTPPERDPIKILLLALPAV